MIKVITPPTVEPLTLPEVKENLRVVFNDEDADISRMIRAARQMAEERLNRALMPQMLAYQGDTTCGRLRLPRPPLRGVDSVTVTAPDGTAQVVTDYRVADFVDPPELLAAYGATLPVGAAVVQYQAGYADAASVPEPIRQWMLLAIGAFYEHRTAIATEQTYALPDDFAKWLLQPYVVYQ